MSDQLHLLDVADDPAARPAPPEPPKWLGHVTAAQRRRALRGLHPTGRRLGPADAACSDCAHCVSSAGNTRNYTKCYLDRERWTAGGGSDIRRRWRACDAFVQNTREGSRECRCSAQRVAPRCLLHGQNGGLRR